MKRMLRRLFAALCVLALCLTPASALSVEEAIELLEVTYVGELPAAAYEATTLEELFAAVGDPYTYYMDAKEYEEFNASVEGEATVTGIGTSIEYTDDGILLTSILPDSGAEAAGLKAGDLIIAVEGISCVPASEEHRNLIIGEEGTTVTITVRHKDGATQDYSIIRKTILLHNTTVTLSDGVGTIDCDTFGSSTVHYFLDGIEKYEEGADSWVVDLRNNTGGYADAAVGTLGIFTGMGPKLYYRFSDGSSFYSRYYFEQATPKPVIVLVNGYSASASEILSGGIRAEQAGIILGSRTYGKGTAQILIDEGDRPDLFDGDSIKITAYRFYCSDGNTTDKIGVLPTLLVSDEYTEAVAALLKAEQPKSGEYLRFMLNGCLFYVDLAAARDSDALAELFAALPPDVAIHCKFDGAVSELDIAGAAKLCGVTYTDRRFTDLSESPYPTQIDTLAVYGILGGDGAGHFNPSSTLTRAQLCAMLAQALNVTSKTPSGFADVPDSVWYAGDVSAIASLGFMGGVGGGRFDPEGTLTQEQFIAVMGRLTRFLNFHADDYALELSDSDLAGAQFAPLASWARTEASVLSAYAGNMLYAELGSIDPSAAVTREQAAATLCNVLKTLHILSY